jgi:LacI family transcriptional regulator
VTTVRDVARHAGVSRQTVSNVLNGRDEMMTSATRDRVVRAIEALDYYPDHNASKLRRSRVGTLALAVLDPSPRFLADAFTAEVVSGAAHCAREHNQGVLLYGLGPLSSQDALVECLRTRRADGVILLPSGDAEAWAPTLRAVVDTERPVVVVQSSSTLDGVKRHVSSIHADDRGGGRYIGALLAELGHRNVLFVGSRVRWPAIDARLAGLREALRAATDRHRVHIVLARDWTAVDGCRAVQRALARPRTDEPITAVVAGNDVLAAGAIVAARNAGLEVPRDISIVGFDDLDLAAATSPALTTVWVPGFEIGVASCADLLRRIENDAAEPQQMVFDTRLVARASTGPAPPTPRDPS